MATNYPIVRLKRAPGERARIKGQKARFPAKIPYDRQAQRLAKVFTDAEKSLATYADGVDVAADPRAVIPERCLVFELLGDVLEFNLAAQALGLEWLATEATSDDDDGEDAEADDDAAKKAPENQKPQRLYLTMPTETALKRLQKQWKLYAKGEPYGDNGQRELWKLFGYLHDLRVWSVEDRLDPTLAAYVANILADDPDEMVTIDLDLWYRNEDERRDKTLETLTDMLEDVDGELLDQVDIPEIRYQGARIRVPGSVANDLVEGNGRIAESKDVMTIRPQSAYESQIEGEATPTETASEDPELTGDCIAALLDGYPVDQHRLLADRLHIVEVDVSGSRAPAQTREHGTAMASLIIHGDLQAPDSAPLNRPLAVLPVLVAPTVDDRETMPKGKMPIGVIYRALKTITAANRRVNSELRRVIVINHSICDIYAPFVRRASPWATLLDYFSHQYNLLFVVSAGNIFSRFPVVEFPNIAAYEDADETTREAAVLGAIEMHKATRTILSPAESVNALTIGAVHSDHADPDGTAPPDPYPTFAMSNLASAVGLGVNRSVKPDFLEAGGRFAAGLTNVRRGTLEVHARPSTHYGQQVAAPSITGQLTRRRLTSGTSNAAALTTRAAHMIADVLDELYEDDEKPWHELKTRAVMLKTLLTHGASWGEVGDKLYAAYPPRESTRSTARKNVITQFLGYGQVDISRVVSGTANRITLLAEDQIHAGDRHEYIVPVPASMLNNREVRTVTITLSWSCPMINTTVDRRAVVLQLTGAKKNTTSFWDGVARAGIPQPNASTASHGTLTHMVLQSNKLMTDESGRLVIGVQAVAKNTFELHDVPYALAITLELGQQTRSQLYTEVAQNVRGRTRTRINS
jgi:hypothetical protein